MLQFGHHPQQLFEAVASEVAPRAFAFSPQELSVTLWALAKAGHAGRAVPAMLHVSRAVLGRWRSGAVSLFRTQQRCIHCHASMPP